MGRCVLALIFGSGLYKDESGMQINAKNGLTEWFVKLFDSHIGELLVREHFVDALLKGWLHLVGGIGDRAKSISHSTLTVFKVLLLVRHLQVAIHLYILKKDRLND